MQLGYKNDFNAAEKELTIVANVFITSLVCCFIFYTFVPLIFIKDNDNWEIPFDTKCCKIFLNIGFNFLILFSFKIFLQNNNPF